MADRKAVVGSLRLAAYWIRSAVDGGITNGLGVYTLSELAAVNGSLYLVADKLDDRAERLMQIDLPADDPFWDLPL